jgi:hypothetical protein
MVAFLAACGGDGPVAPPMAPPPAPGSVVTLAFCTNNAPRLVAMQDGAAGTWTRVSPFAGSTYRLTFQQDRGAVAFVDSTSALNTYVTYGTVGELRNVGAAVASGRCGRFSMTSSVAGLPSGQIALLSVPGRAVRATGVGPVSFVDMFNGAPVVTGYRAAENSFLANRIVVRRNVVFFPDGSVPPFDFDAADAVEPVNATVLLGCCADPDLIISTVLQVGNAASDVRQLTPRYRWFGNSFLGVQGLPADRLAPEETQAVRLELNSATQSRVTYLHFRTLQQLPIGPPPALTVPSFTRVASAPYARVRLQVESQPEYGRSMNVVYSQPGRAWVLRVSAAYLGARPARWELTMPDLTPINGFNPAWGLNAAPIEWTIFPTGGADPWFDGNPQDGLVRTEGFLQAQPGSPSVIP